MEVVVYLNCIKCHGISLDLLGKLKMVLHILLNIIIFTIIKTDAITDLTNEGVLKTYSTYTATNISVSGKIVGAVFSTTMDGEAFLLYGEYKGKSRFYYCYGTPSLTPSSSTNYKIIVYYI